MLDVLRQDLRFTLRTLVRNPRHAVLVVITLAVGIGAAAAMFSVLNAVLLRPLPMREQDRLIEFGYDLRAEKLSHLPTGMLAFNGFRKSTRTLSDVAAYEFHGADEWTMREGDAAGVVFGTRVTGNFFRVLGTTPALGRTLRPEDDVAGADPVVVISHAFWRRHFGSDPRVIGRHMQNALYGVSYTVVGVMPEGFGYPSGVDLWTPFATFTPASGGTDLSYVNVYPVGRLAPGATQPQARAELTAFLRRTLDPPWNATASAITQTVPAILLADVRPVIWTLSAAVLLLLLIACANVANLLLMRGTTRERELAVRTAIGASRLRLVRQLMTEHLVLAVLGGAGGVALAVAAVRILAGMPGANLPRLDAVHVDLRVLLTSLGLTLGSALLFGLLPAFTGARASSPNAAQRLDASRRTSRTRQALVTFQITMAVVMLAGAGLLLRSLRQLQHVDVGFALDHVIVAQLNLPLDKFGPKLSHLYGALNQGVEQARTIPGVSAAGVTALAPFVPTTGFFGRASAADGKADGVRVRANTEYVGSGYIEALGIRLERGRAIEDRDRADAPRVVVVSSALAHTLWPAEDAVGKRLKLGDDSAVTVIGVVADTRYRDIRSDNPVVYLPYQQLFGMVPFYLFVRTPESSATIIPLLRNRLKAIDPDLTLVRTSALATWLDAPLATPRFDTGLFTLFGSIALVLTAIGIYGVMAMFVRLRTREIGIRMAVGASHTNVRHLILVRGFRLALPGILIGLALSVAVTRVLRSQLFEVAPTDAIALGTVALLALAVAAIACWVPARAAARLDPVTALRSLD